MSYVDCMRDNIDWDCVVGWIIAILFVSFVVFLIAGVTISGINEQKEFKRQCVIQDTFFKGEHELQCLGNKSSMSGSFTYSRSLFGGSGSGSMTGSESVKFIWKNEDTSMLIPTVLPVNKVKIVLLGKDDPRKPFVQFGCWYYTRDYGAFENNWMSNVIIAYVCIKEEQVDNNIYFKLDTDNTNVER